MGVGAKIGIIVAILAVLLVAVIFMGYINARNQAVRLETRFEAQEGKVELVYDKTWKILSQQAQLTDKYAGDFKDIYATIMSERYSSDDGSLMKWIQERNPEFDNTLYIRLSNSIEGLRQEFAHEQEVLLAIKQDHDNLRLIWPSSMFVGGRAELEVHLVTSGKTKGVIETGEENDVNLFQKQ